MNHGSRSWPAMARALCVALPVALWGAQAVGAPEEQITTTMIGDFEFDSARDGRYCPACNFGDGNSRVVFTATDGSLWLAQVDRASGRFVPADGHGTRLDVNAAYFTDFGNGPSWMFSQRGSELVYTRYQDGLPHSSATAGIAWAHMVGPGQWTAGPVAGGLGRVNPKGTQETSNATPLVSYGSASRGGAWWRQGDFNSPEQALPMGDSNRGLGLRWVQGTQQLLLSGTVPGSSAKQIFLFDTSTGRTEQITSGPGNKRAQFMFFPPEYGGQAVFFVVVDDVRFDFYWRQADPQTGLAWTRFQSQTPPPELPYIAGSPEAFVHNGRSWLLFTMSDSNKPAPLTTIALLSLDPAQPELRRLNDADAPARWRSDPEYYIGDTDVYIYYSRAKPLQALLNSTSEGIWRVATGLGPPRP